MSNNSFLEVKRKHLEERLGLLVKQYTAVSAELNLSVDPATRAIFRARLEEIEKAVEATDAELRTLLRGLAPVPAEQDAAGKNVKFGQPPPPAGPQFGAGKKWAVLVGINQYEDAANYGSLSVCVKDVEAVAGRLDACGYVRPNVLTDNTPGRPPTRNQIIAALRAAADATEPDDLLLFYFSGHGDVADGDGYLVSRDAFRNALSDTAISIVRVEQIMRAARARAKVLILDACHSGADIPGKGPLVMTEQFIKQVYEQAEGLAILGSCKQGELSYERDEKDLSAFTHYLLEGLSGAADMVGKNFVTVQDASAYVSSGVKQWAVAHTRTQTPTLSYEVAGDIILADYRK